MKILLAVDGSAFSEEAVREVARRPWPEGSEIKVISAVEPAYVPAAEPWVLPDNYFEELDRLADDRGRSAVESALKLLSDREGIPVKVSTARPRGPAQKEILEEAEAWGAELIVLGSHGYGFWNRLLLGSVSQAVAAHAPCSVEIVKRPLPAEGEGRDG